MAKASGASAKEIRKLSEELINQEVAEKRVNAVKAYSIYLEAKRVASLEDATDAEKARLKESIESYNNLNSVYNDSVKEKNKLIFDNKVAEVQEATDRHKELIKKEAEYLKQLEQQKQQAFESAKKLEEKYLTDLQNLRDKTDEEKLDRQKKRDLAEIEALRQKGIDVSNLLVLNAEKYNILESDLKKKRELEIKEEYKLRDEELRLGDEERTQAKNDKDAEEGRLKLENAKYNFEENKKIEEATLANKIAISEAEKNLGNQAIAVAKDIFGKNKNIQKGIVVAESGLALGRLAINTVEQVSKDNTASPLTFGLPWSGVHIAQGVLGATSIVSNANKALSAIGGGGSVSSGGGSGISAPSGGSVPQVGFQNSGENQIASTINQNQQAQPPIQAFVVSSEVTTSQALDRNKINANSLGG